MGIGFKEILQDDDGADKEVLQQPVFQAASSNRAILKTVPPPPTRDLGTTRRQLGTTLL